MGIKELQARIDKLRQMPKMMDMREYFEKVYDFDYAADLATTGMPDTPKNKKAYIKEHGTKAECVKKDMKWWQEHHPKGRD